MYSAQNSKELQERLIQFTLSIISLSKLLSKTSENLIISNQIVRSASSVGANYAEAIYSYSRPDFIHNIKICKKEAGETLYWLELLERTSPKQNISKIKLECTEILRIFVAIVKSSQGK